MKLKDFLLHKTHSLELCVIREDGWIRATFWMDSEDLFTRYLDSMLGTMEVKNDEWDYIAIVNENAERIKIPCHYIDV